MVGAGEMIQPMLPLFIKGGWVAVPSFTMPPDKAFLVKAKRVKEGFEYSFIREEDYWVKDTLNYEYCTVMQPYAHQKDTVKFLVEHPRAFVFNGQGSGKSLSCLWAIDYLYKTQTLKKKVLIVAPLSTLQSVWGKEIFTHFFYYKFNLIRGTAEKRNTLINEQVHFNIINHDGLTNMIQRGDINPDHYDLIIYDEATALKTPTANRFKQFYAFSSKVPSVWMLTGTPIAQSPLDAFALRKIMDPTWRMTYYAFREVVMYKATMFKWTPKKDATDVCHRILQPAIRYSLDDCVDLPPHTIIPFEVPLTKQQQKIFDALRKDLMITLESGSKIIAANAAILLGKLLQCSAGVVYDLEGRHEVLDFSNRLTALTDIINEAATPVVVFVPYRGVQAILVKELNSIYGHDQVALINGDTSLAERTEIMRKFQACEIKILLAHPKTTSHGIDLTASNTIVWYLPTHSNELYLQSLDRIRRLSSLTRNHKNFLVYQFYSTKIEENIYKSLAEKGLTQAKVLELIRQK